MKSNAEKHKVIAVVPAAGVGQRMKSDLPKQYLKIKGYTILEYTLSTLLLHPRIVYIVVSLNKKDNFFHTLSISSNTRIVSVIGGEKRIDSVLSGLMLKTNIKWVIIHDAVRPCLTYADLDKLILLTKKNPVGAILAKPVSDTMKYSDKKQKKCFYTINRNNLWHALTPQLFRMSLLRRCLQKIIQDNVTVTDEASALEYYGYHSLLIRGRSSNIKVTWPEDFKLAEYYLYVYKKIGKIY